MTTNRVNGLRPMGDRPSAGNRNNSRTESPRANSIRTPGLTPTARPVDTYARPEAPAQDNGMLQLARALGEINPTISNFFNEEAGRQRKDAEDRAMRRIGGMSYSEAKAAVEAGMPEMDNPWFKAAFMKVMGERTAHSRMNEMRSEYALDPNRHEIDFSEFVRSRASEDHEAFNDPHFSAGYGPLMDNFEATGAAKHGEVQSARTMDEAKANVFGVFLGMAQDASAEGRDPNLAASAIFDRYASQKEVLGLSVAEQDALMIDAINTIANDGDWELVDALLNHARVDDFGNVSSLANSPEYAVKTASIIDRAKTARANAQLEVSAMSLTDLNQLASQGNLTWDIMKAYAEEHTFMTTSKQVELMTRSENARLRAQQEIAEADQKAGWQLHAEQSHQVIAGANLASVQTGTSPHIFDTEVPDGKGGVETLTAKKQRDRLAIDLMAFVKEQGAATDASPEAMLDLEVKLFATAGVENPRWAQLFAGGVAQATPSNLKQFLESGENVLPPALASSIELYEQLHTKSPLLLNQYFSDSGNRRFYELVVQGKKLGQDDYAAVRSANQALMNGEANHPMSSMNYRQAEEALREVGVGGWWLFGKSEPENAGYALQQINDNIGYFAAVNGHVGEAAKQAAVEQFANTHVNINGLYVNVQGENIGDPEQFSSAVDLALHEIVAKNDHYLNGQQLGIEELSIRPTGNGSGEWEVVSKGAGYALPLHGVAPFNLNDLAGAVQRDADLKMREAEYEQSVARYKSEGMDAQRREAQIAELHQMIKSMEAVKDTPHLQRAFSVKSGEHAARAYLGELPAKIEQRRSELKALEEEQTMFMLDITSGRTNPDHTPQPIPSLLNF